MAKVLIIDDDSALLDMLCMVFEDAGYAVLSASDGGQGLVAIERERPDAVVSDVNMPVVDGFTLCRRLREQANRTPLILLTSRDSEIDEALGLELGADDYVTKPFSNRVLVARVAALLRRDALARDEGPTPQPPREIDGLSLDAERLRATYRDKLLEVTLTEFRLLETLTSRPGIVRSRDEILEQVRGDDSVVGQRLVDTYVRRLRRKLETIDPNFDRIETVVGVGYRWKDQNGG